MNSGPPKLKGSECNLAHYLELLMGFKHFILTVEILWDEDVGLASGNKGPDVLLKSNQKHFGFERGMDLNLFLMCVLIWDN